MTYLRHHTRFTIAFVVALVVIGAAASLSLAKSSSSSPPATPAPSVSPTAFVSSSLTQHFAVLREGSEAGDSGVTMFGHVGEGGGSSYDIDPRAARSAPNAFSIPAWVIPGNEGVCLYLVPSTEPGQPARVACGSIVQALSGDIQDLVTINGKQVLFGLAPNGNSKVTAVEKDGASNDVPVTSNVYSVDAAQGISTVELRDQNGTSQKIEAP